MKPWRALAPLAALVVHVASPPHAHGGELEYPPFKLGLTYQFVATGFELKSRDISANKLTYRPSQSNYAGLILGYRWISGTVSFAVPADAEVRDREGISKYRDYRLSYYTKRLGVEASYTRYLGYLIDEGDPPYTRIPDLETLGYGLNVFFTLFKSSEFSLAAAIDQSARQGKSAGSPILVANWRHQNVTSASPLVPGSQQSGYGVDSALSSVHAANYAVGGGYGFCFVSGPFYAAALGAIALGYQSASYLVGTTEATHRSAQANLMVRVSTGFNAKHYFVVGDVYFDRFGQQTQSIELGTNVYGVTLAAGVRF